MEEVIGEEGSWAAQCLPLHAATELSGDAVPNARGARGRFQHCAAATGGAGARKLHGQGRSRGGPPETAWGVRGCPERQRGRVPLENCALVSRRARSYDFN